MPTILEVVAVLFTMLSVVLTIYKDIWLWPTGIVGILAFLVVFGQAHLYSDATLQVIFLGQSLYGWYYWKHPKKYATDVPVTFLDDAQKAVIGAACLGAILGVGFVLKRFTDDPMPFLDASVGVLSVAAQWLLMRKVFENWHVWIMVNVISVYVYFSKGLNLTAIEYVIFFALAIVGYGQWKHDRDYNVRKVRAK